MSLENFKPEEYLDDYKKRRMAIGLLSKQIADLNSSSRVLKIENKSLTEGLCKMQCSLEILQSKMEQCVIDFENLNARCQAFSDSVNEKFKDFGSKVIDCN